MVMEAITKDLLLLDTRQELATTIEVHKEFKDMEVIIKDLLDTATVKGIPMFTKTENPTMDLMDMKLIMTTKRDLLRLDMALLVKATSMSADHILTTRSRFIILKPTTMDMERGLLSLDMATGLLLFMSSSLIMDMDITQHLMNMATISTRDPLNLDMAMSLLLFMLSSWIMVMAIIQHLMNMDITSTRELLMLDMNPTKVTKMFPTPHTLTMRSMCTTLTKHQATDRDCTSLFQYSK